MAELTALQRLAQEHGVGVTFRGWDGAEKAVSPATLVAVLTALDVPCKTDDDVTVSLRAAELAPLQRTLPPAVVVRQGDATEIPVNVSPGAQPRVRILLEDGSRRDVEVVAGGPHQAAGVPRDRLAALSEREAQWLSLLVEQLPDELDLEPVTTLVYGVPKLARGLELDADPTDEVKADQKEFFKLLYNLLVGKDRGPRLPTLIVALGADRVRALLTP